MKRENDISRPIRVLISGGGTGGHIFPAIAIADAIREKSPDAEILFVGAKGKMEMEKVPKAGYPIEGLWISGFHRSLDWRNLLFPFKLLSSMWKAGDIVRRFKPDVAVGVGGYASGPVLRVASRRGIPCLIQEQNSYAGVTNRLLAAKVSRICVAYDQMERYFPKEKIVLTGNPVRRDLREAHPDKAEAARYYDLLPDRPTIFVFGGSLGAYRLNEAMAANAALLAQHPEVQVIWQAGSLYYDRFKESKTARLPNVRIRPFIIRMDLAYTLSDVVICRAGALTISELCLLGQPAILVPSPNVAEDHQTKNAKALVNHGAALMISDNDAPEKMIEEALHLLTDKALLSNLSENARKLAHPDAAERIAGEVLQLAAKPY